MRLVVIVLLMYSCSCVRVLNSNSFEPDPIMCANISYANSSYSCFTSLPVPGDVNTLSLLNYVLNVVYTYDVCQGMFQHLLRLTDPQSCFAKNAKYEHLVHLHGLLFKQYTYSSSAEPDQLAKIIFRHEELLSLLQSLY
jgi:hypothetical protein